MSGIKLRYPYVIDGNVKEILAGDAAYRMKNPTLLMVAALVIGLVLTIFGTQSGFTTQTNDTTVSVTASENEVSTKGQTYENTPDGESSSSVEGTLSKDSASVKVEQQHKFNFPSEITDPLTEAKDSIFGAIGSITD